MHPNKTKRAAMRHPVPRDEAPKSDDPKPGSGQGAIPENKTHPDGTTDAGEAAAQAADDATEGKDAA